MASSSPPAPPASLPRVIAVYGPTASGKTAVAAALRDRVAGEVISADSAALYSGLPIITAAPAYPARLVGVVPLSDEVSVGAYERLAHAAIDEIVEAGRTAIVVGGTGLYLRAALSSLELPPPPTQGARERWEAEYDRLGPEAAHDELARVDADAAARVHPNDRRRVVRALELAELGVSLAPGDDRLWGSETRHPTLLVALDLPRDELDRRIEGRARDMATAGAAAEAAAAWASPLSGTARNVLGLEAFATLPEEEAIEAVITATKRLARYQRKWLRRLPVAATLAAGRPPEEIADEIVALGRAGEHLPRS
jgi:tRNA dimethylallyltransferase